MKISSGKSSNGLLLILLIVALLFALYYYVVLPKKDEVTSLESSVSTLKSEVSNLEEQVASLNQEEEPSTSLFALRKKMPQSRELDQLLLNLEEIEYLTDSRILAVNFNSYDELISESNLIPASSEPEQAEETQNSEENTSEENTDETEEKMPISSISTASLPAELKLITFSLDIEAPTATSLEEFIQEIEKLERIMHIDSIDYSLPGEEDALAEDPQNHVSATVQVTTFYYEGDQ